MDETAEYILMCREALPIQEAFRTDRKYVGFHTGHFIAWGYKDDPDQHIHISVLGKDIEYDWQRDCLFQPGKGHGSHTPEKYKVLSEYKWIWIPRLDQLLDMIEGMYNSKISRLYFFCFGFSEFKSVYRTSPLFTFKSPEQVALGLVMYDNYKMVWDENKWIDFINKRDEKHGN